MNKPKCAPLNLTADEIAIVNEAVVNYMMTCERNVRRAKMFSPRSVASLQKNHEVANDVVNKINKVMEKRG